MPVVHRCLYDRALNETVLFHHYVGDGGRSLLGGHVGKESEVPHIDSEDWNILPPHPAGGPEESAVTAKRHRKIGLYISPREHSGGLDVEMQRRRKVLVVGSVDEVFGSVVTDGTQDIGHRSGTQRRVFIAENGKTYRV